jgi:signal recognition particle subunit SRP54
MVKNPTNRNGPNGTLAFLPFFIITGIEYILAEKFATNKAKIAKNQFNFNDFLNQIQQIKKMGNLKDLASMIPGVGKAIKDIDIDDNAFKSIEAIINSMTPKERTNPEILNGSRRQRIAKGSGTNIQEVNRLLKQFDQTRKMMKLVTGSKMGKMMMPGMPKMKR